MDTYDILENFLNKFDGKAAPYKNQTLNLEELGVKVLMSEAALDGLYNAPRRPVFAIRGKPITPTQAREILLATDYRGGKEPKYHNLYFENSWVLNPEKHVGHKCYTGNVYGWCYPNGYIGGNNYMREKNPFVDELIYPWCEYIRMFPYLDLVFALTDRDESLERHDMTGEISYDPFIETVIAGLHVYDGKVEALSKGKARLLFKQYDKKYGCHKMRYYRHNEAGIGNGIELIEDPVKSGLQVMQTDDPEFIIFPEAVSTMLELRNKSKAEEDYSKKYCYQAEYNSSCYQLPTVEFYKKMIDFLSSTEDTDRKGYELM